jgi:hypothetical protein
MSALGSDSLNFAACIEQQNLSAFDALDLDLPLDTRAKLKGGDVFEFVLRHSFASHRQVTSALVLYIESSTLTKKLTTDETRRVHGKTWEEKEEQ